MQKNERKAKKTRYWNILKIAGAGIIGQALNALKCFRNAQTGRRAGQGDEWLGLGSRSAEKQA